MHGPSEQTPNKILNVTHNKCYTIEILADDKCDIDYNFIINSLIISTSDQSIASKKVWKM